MINSINASSKKVWKEWIKIKIVLLLFLIGAVFTDLYKNKIYNIWVIPFLVSGLIIAMIHGGESFINSVMAVTVAFLVLMPVYLLKGIAAGDVKLFLSTASFLSMQELYSCLLYSFLIAGAISLGIIIFKRNKKNYSGWRSWDR